MTYETVYDASTKFWIPWFLIIAIIITAIVALYLVIGIYGVRHDNDHIDNVIIPAVLLVVTVYALISAINYGGSEQGHYVKVYNAGDYKIIEGEITDFDYSTNHATINVEGRILRYSHLTTFTFNNPLPEEGYIKTYCISEYDDNDYDTIVRVDILVDD